ncbi:hypothetical protein JZ751_013759 [Albula glossodonta]|uniref:Uncharacterized protein n=1 Tax=Albula glossodonta TaxID=121402 RepID=A0A8T2NTQ0_9TELE|nr:hypothetical protein JZ751_013759 [Albula glossodonta]
MAGCSAVSLGTARSFELDSSVCDSRMAETSTDQLFLGVTPEDADGVLPKVETRVVLVGEAGRNEELVRALQVIKMMEVPVVKLEDGPSGSESGQKLIKSIVTMDLNVPCMKTDDVREFGDGENAEFETVFVLTDFGSPDYSYLHKNESRILGPPVVLHCAETEETAVLHYHAGPRSLLHWLSQERGSCEPGHSGPSYGRNNSQGLHGFVAGEEEFRTEFKVPPFQDCVLSFLGFPEEERKSMEERTLMHGGRFLEVGDEKCTHLVVEENSWFWGSIQMDGRAGESMYLYEKKCASLMSLDIPRSNRKKRRLKDAVAQLSREAELSPFPPRKRPSAELSFPAGSLQDLSGTPESNSAPRDLEKLLIDWSEEKSVGGIILKYSKHLAKAYPQFVNFFEMSKETIVRCERLKPRFHAFLKINQAKPECGRQTLAELLIRPVQRLPSVVLLLNDIKKHTAEDNPDKVTLERAVASLKEVMTHINEDKRKTEGQKQIFDVVYEVDGCPRVDTVALGDEPCDRGDHVTLFLFNDCLEIAKRRNRGIGTFRTPLGQTRAPAPLKHVVLMPLSQIKRVLDLRETEECRNAFALLVQLPTERDHLLFSFQLEAEDVPKAAWLKTLCRQVANTICRADADVLIRCTDPDSLQVNTRDMDSTLSRASRAIKKTSKKVTRAFSFGKMPKRALHRALVASRSPNGSEGKKQISALHSPSMVDLPSTFERRYLGYSRSTSHLL